MQVEYRAWVRTLEEIEAMLEQDATPSRCISPTYGERQSGKR